MEQHEQIFIDEVGPTPEGMALNAPGSGVDTLIVCSALG